MDNEGYSDGARVAAVLATILFPWFAVIAALLLAGGERNAYRRGQLRTWAWASGGFLVVQVLFVVVAVRSP